MAMNRAGFSDLLAPGFRSIFFNSFEEYPAEYTQLFNVNSSERQYEDDSSVTGFGQIPKGNEGSPVTYDEVFQGFDKRYTHDTYKLGYRITLEMMEDELYGKMKKLPDALGRSMRNTIETDAANMFNNGFNAGFTGADGVELFSTVHPLQNGGTQSNELATAADLSATSLEQALIDIAATTDDRGLLLQLRPNKLVVSPSMEWTAKKLLNSIKDPDSPNNAINPAANTGLQLVVNHYLTDPDAWFIICDRHEMNWFWRKKPNHTTDNDFGTDNGLFKVRARWSRGWSHPWGVFGSPGV